MTKHGSDRIPKCRHCGVPLLSDQLVCTDRYGYRVHLECAQEADHERLEADELFDWAVGNGWE